MMKAGVFNYRWIWAVVITLTLLYGANWFLTPEIVGIRKLESAFRPKGKRQCDSQKWKQKEPSSWGERYEMVDDLLRKHLHSGLTREEVEGLLGKPDVEAIRGDGELELSYSLASQKDYPARSVLFPGVLQNLELWVLLLRFRGGQLYSAEVVPD
ncbi:hypothetical protein [Limisphaera sp. VF-2]|jgi:hypothetical protein|uniref:hypothetical protein n=1 Tax=Limisphaera sp. VF-2 TaxID=3400418 RepID=UPI0017704786